MKCKNSAEHVFPIKDSIPSFVSPEEIPPKDAKWVFEYDERAEQYDQGVKMYDLWLGINLEDEYRKVVAQLPVSPSQTILDVSTGTGAVIFRMVEAHPNAIHRFLGLDLSIGMLRVAQRKFIEAGIEVPLFHSRVEALPFADASFDIVTHAGGINTINDIPATLNEFVCVLRPNGTLLILDEGLSPSARKTQRGLEIVKANKLFGLWPPLEHLPPLVKDIEVKWIARDTFFAIKCQKLSDDELKSVKANGDERA